MNDFQERIRGFPCFSFGREVDIISGFGFFSQNRISLWGLGGDGRYEGCVIGGACVRGWLACTTFFPWGAVAAASGGWLLAKGNAQKDVWWWRKKEEDFFHRERIRRRGHYCHNRSLYFFPVFLLFPLRIAVVLYVEHVLAVPSSSPLSLFSPLFDLATPGMCKMLGGEKKMMYKRGAEWRERACIFVSNFISFNLLYVHRMHFCGFRMDCSSCVV